MGDSLPAKGDDLGLVQAHPAAAANPDAKLFAIATIGNTEGLHLGDRWVGKEKLLDFPRVNILAAADNHILQSSDNIAVTLFVDRRQIARMHESRAVDRS